MKTLSALAVSTLLATLAIGCGDSGALDDELNTATFALAEGSPEAIGLLAFLNAPTTTIDILDKQVPLNRRTARNLVHHRDGFDGISGTYDDNLFDTLAEVDAVRWVGPSAMDALISFALTENLLPSGDDTLGTWDGVLFTVDEAEATLTFVNQATLAQLDGELGLDRRAASAIVAGQPLASIATLSALYYVGGSALNILKAAATAESELPDVDVAFIDDLTRHLDDWYAAEGDTIVAAGGEVLIDAKAAISRDRVEGITHKEDDPHGYDLTTTVLLAHPDVVFPASGSVWFGAYDKGTGELIEITRVE